MKRKPSRIKLERDRVTLSNKNCTTKTMKELGLEESKYKNAQIACSGTPIFLIHKLIALKKRFENCLAN